MQVLDLSHNQLTHLQPGLSSLTALTAVHLHHNHFRTLAPELSLLDRLQHLSVSHNYLSGGQACLAGLLPRWPHLAVLELDNVSDKHGSLAIPAQLAASRCVAASNELKVVNV